MKIRMASEHDLPGLMMIEAECFGPEKFNEEIVRAFCMREDAFVLCALQDDDVVGSAMCLISEKSKEGRVASVAVLKESRRAGIGSRLLEACEKAFRARGLVKYSLEVDVENEPAISLYSSFGYTVVGVIPDFYGSGRDAYWMEKSAATKRTRLKARTV